MSKIKVFISLPMKDKSKEQIKKEMDFIKNKVDGILSSKGEDFEVIDTYVEDYNLGHDGENLPLKYLAKSLEFLSEADLAVFGQGWEIARGCKIEHTCASDYGIPIYYINNLN